MLLLYVVFTVVRGFFTSREALVWENAFLRYRAGILKRKPRRILFRRWDKALLIWLSQRVRDWKSALYLVQPDTLIKWHRNAFRWFWSWKVGKNGGRHVLPAEVVKLIREISIANPRWGAPRIHGELLKLGIDVSQSSVQKYLLRSKFPRPFKQDWRTFLKNHTKEVVAIDFFLVPTIWLSRLYVLVILSHDRRKILRFAVTGKPSTRWTAQQLREAHPFAELPKMVLHDRDKNFWGLRNHGFNDVITAHKCPWQNSYVERVIGTVRRECTDHVIAFNERQLTRVLGTYQDYYNNSRTHLTLNKDSPVPRSIEKSRKIFSIPKVGGLHHEFRRMAA